MRWPEGTFRARSRPFQEEQMNRPRPEVGCPAPKGHPSSSCDSHRLGPLTRAVCQMEQGPEIRIFHSQQTEWRGQLGQEAACLGGLQDRAENLTSVRSCYLVTNGQGPPCAKSRRNRAGRGLRGGQDQGGGWGGDRTWEGAEEGDRTRGGG